MALQREEALRLLEKYMEGETSIEEERLITEFLESEEADEEFDDYKLMFEGLQCGAPLFSDDELDEIAASLPVVKPARQMTWFTIGKWMAAACVVALAFYIGTQTAELPTTEVRTEYITKLVEHHDTVVVEKPVTVTKYVTKYVAQQATATTETPSSLADIDLEEQVNSLIEDFDIEKEIRNFDKEMNNFSEMDLSL